MYHGKFQSANKEGTPVTRTSSTNTTRTATQATRSGTAQTTRTAAQTTRSTSSQSGRTGTTSRTTQSQTARTAQTTRTAQPAAQSAKPVKEKRGPRVGGVIFYTIYFLFIFIFCAALYLGRQWLLNWLVSYEASQPTVKCQEVFDELFSDPDWASLYEMAGVEDTPYEGVDEYVSYMEEKVAGQELTYTETSAGTSGDKKYYVKLGDERVASFTLTGQTENLTDIPDWTLGTVELYFERNEGYLIEKVDGHTAYVNGSPLDESFTIRTSTTSADEYLPIGTSGVKTCTQQIDGLLVTPTVTINDQDGNAVEVTYDEESGTFSESSVSSVMPDDLKERATNAFKQLATFLNTKNATNLSASRSALAEYFDTSGTAYKECMELDDDWIKSGSDPKYLNLEVSEYVRYSDEIFSARLTMDYTISMSDGSGLKTYPMDYTLFFYVKNDKWMVYDMTMGSVQTATTQVRLTFMDGDTELSTGFYDTDVTELTTPVVSIPEGKTLSWVRKDTNESGQQTLTIVFTPDQTTGVVTLGTAAELEPMTLYVYLEDTATAEAAAAETTAETAAEETTAEETTAETTAEGGTG